MFGSGITLDKALLPTANATPISRAPCRWRSSSSTHSRRRPRSSKRPDEADSPDEINEMKKKQKGMGSIS